MIGALIRAAVEKRAQTFLGRTVDAYRIVNGRKDGAPQGLAIDRYASWLVVSARDDLSTDTVDDWCRAADEALAPSGIVLKRLCRDPRRSTSTIVSGAPPASPIAIREQNATLLCDLNDGIPTGLYLDHRETRLRAREFASGVETLNLFAYTGAFSVHAALGGATRVTSVDSSRKALRRGRENMVASELDPDAHRWFSDDVRAHLMRTARKSPCYGLVILDPPAFGHARTASTALDVQFDTLIELSARALTRDGVIVVSSHTAGFSRARLISSLKSAANGANRLIGILPIATTPAPDFPTSAGDDSTQTVFARMG